MNWTMDWSFKFETATVATAVDMEVVVDVAVDMVDMEEATVATEVMEVDMVDTEVVTEVDTVAMEEVMEATEVSDQTCVK